MIYWNRKLAAAWLLYSLYGRIVIIRNVLYQGTRTFLFGIISKRTFVL